MRSVTEYTLKALEFDGLAAATTEAALKKRYADLAECYRLLATERQRLITDGTIPDSGGSHHSALDRRSDAECPHSIGPFSRRCPGGFFLGEQTYFMKWADITSN
jgi:hypothetical protein